MVRLNMLNMDIEKQARRCPMYSEPNFEIIEWSDEDIVATSLTDEGEIDLGGLGSFEWF